MNVIEQKANLIANKATTSGNGFAFDPTIILVIVQVVQALMKAFAECENKPADLPKRASDPGILGRWHVRRAVRQAFADDEMYNHIGPRMVKAILDVGTTVTDEEATQLFAEAVD